ncbi:MAG: Rab family GTPase [Gemmatimonadaceae bacterium]
MIQKKICMVGVFGTGKTSLVQRYVRSIFSPSYLSTVGVKIDRKEIVVGGQDVHLMLWDLEGRDAHHDVNTSYLKGAAGIIYVVDGTRAETLPETQAIRQRVISAIGAVPSVLALNKADLVGEWALPPDDALTGSSAEWRVVRTSAKSGAGVDAMFQWVAESVTGTQET